jgi:hypothetical protein
MTLFIKPCRIIDPPSEPSEARDPALSATNWIEFESNINIEDAEIPFVAVVVSHFRVNSSEEWLLRPRDFEKARDWVFDTSIISREDKPRIMWLLNTMEDDSEIYLHLSW